MKPYKYMRKFWLASSPKVCSVSKFTIRKAKTLTKSEIWQANFTLLAKFISN